jgi:Flp pilus assembly protein TadD
MHIQIKEGLTMRVKELIPLIVSVAFIGGCSTTEDRHSFESREMVLDHQFTDLASVSISGNLIEQRIAAYERDLKSSSSEVRYRSHLALCRLHLSRGEMPKAKSHLTASARLFPERPATRLLGAEVAIYDGNWAMADYLLDQVAAKTPASAEIHRIRALREYRAENRTAALRHLTRAHQVDANNMAVCVNMVRLQLERNDLATAQKQQANCRKIDPRHLDVEFLEAVLLGKSGRLDAAEERFISLLQVNSDSQGVRYNLAVVLFAKGDIPSAKRHLDYLMSQRGFARSPYYSDVVALAEQIDEGGQKR